MGNEPPFGLWTRSFRALPCCRPQSIGISLMPAFSWVAGMQMDQPLADVPLMAPPCIPQKPGLGAWFSHTPSPEHFNTLFDNIIRLKFMGTQTSTGLVARSLRLETSCWYDYSSIRKISTFLSLHILNFTKYQITSCSLHKTPFRLLIPLTSSLFSPQQISTQEASRRHGPSASSISLLASCLSFHLLTLF